MSNDKLIGRGRIIEYINAGKTHSCIYIKNCLEELDRSLNKTDCDRLEEDFRSNACDISAYNYFKCLKKLTEKTLFLITAVMGIQYETDPKKNFNFAMQLEELGIELKGDYIRVYDVERLEAAIYANNTAIDMLRPIAEDLELLHKPFNEKLVDIFNYCLMDEDKKDYFSLPYILNKGYAPTPQLLDIERVAVTMEKVSKGPIINQ